VEKRSKFLRKHIWLIEKHGMSRFFDNHDAGARNAVRNLPLVKPVGA